MTVTLGLTLGCLIASTAALRWLALAAATPTRSGSGTSITSSSGDHPPSLATTGPRPATANASRADDCQQRPGVEQRSGSEHRNGDGRPQPPHQHGGC